MEIPLTPELEQLIRQRVESGQYLSVDEVVQEALWLLEERDWVRERKLARLKEMIAVGIEQCDRGEVAPLDMDEIRAEVQRRLEEEREAP